MTVVAKAGGSRRARLLNRVALACLALLPPVMAIAHRSSPLLLALAALFGLAAVHAEGRLAGLGQNLAGRLSGSLGVTVLAFLLWAAASVAWSPAPLASLFAWGEFALPLAAGLIAAAILPARMWRHATTAFAVGLIVAGLIIFGDLASHMILRQALHLRAAPYVLNRSALTLLVLLPVALLLLWREGRMGLAALVVLAVGAAIFKSESGAAKLGLFALAGMGVLTLVSRRLGLVLAGLALFVAIALAPVSGELGERLLPPSIYRALAAAHAQERVDIWRSYGAALRIRPFLGFGFQASPALATARVTEPLAPDQRFQLAVGHPHSAALQIWVELGAIGAGLAALIAMLAIRAVQRLDPAQCAAMTALIAAALADSLVGQGAWQGWWPAGIAASLIWLGHDRARQHRTHYGPA